MPRFLGLFALVSLWLGTVPALAQEPIWLEGEAPASTTFPFSTGGWGHAEHLSEGKWLFAVVEPNQVEAKIPTDGIGISYTCDIPQAGEYTLWVRIGYEFARAPFRWRLGDRPWSDVQPEDYTTDLMTLADFAEVAWKSLGTVPLKPGKQTLELRILRPTRLVDGQPQPTRLLFGLDAICLSQKPFLPNGPHRPGSSWRTAQDRDAADVRFEFPPPDTGTAAQAKDEAKRRTLRLGGTWQIARYDEPGEIDDRTGPIAALPTDLDTLHWKAIHVPANMARERPEWEYCHRYLYRCRVQVPAELRGKSFVLRFPNNALLTTVFVNGTRCGHSRTPSTLWECDVTDAIKPGETNEIIVGIKDLYYAMSRTAEGQSARRLFHLPLSRFHGSGLPPTRFADFPVMFKVRRSGILETPILVAGGAAYTADLFCKPSVAKRRLGLDLTIQNPTDLPLEVEIINTVRPLTESTIAKRFDPVKAIVMPDEPLTVALEEPWTDAKLWWPDDPQQYIVETTLNIAGKPVDRLETKFGFREWGIAGTKFTLNGIPWQFRADLRHHTLAPGTDPAAAVAEWRKNGQNMMRFWGDIPWTGASQAETLDFFDAAGVPVRRSGIFDGEVASYQLVIDGKPHLALFDNWRAQLAAWVKAERNHPSVFIWSIENEITYINARNFGWLKQVEPEIQKAADSVMALDPTRPVMIDGGDALMKQTLPVYGNHYLEQDKRDYPDEAYTLTHAYAPRDQRPGQSPWPIGKDKPLFLGESYFANGSPPAAFAEISGESAFLGRREAATGVTRFARMLSEGYRWHGVAAFQFWFAEGPQAEHYRAWQPVCVLVREWDSTWDAGTKQTRTLKVFNDTRHPDPITVHWLFQTRGVGNVSQIRGKKEFVLPPGGNEEFSLALDVPTVPPDTHVEAELVLTCVRQGKEVFRDRKPLRLLGPVRKLDTLAGRVALWDPAGKATGIPSIIDTVSIKSLDAIPSDCPLLIVGPDAVTPQLATDPIWSALAVSGKRILVLDQTHPLQYLATPAHLEPTTHTGRIAFPENPTHPAFFQLGASDFFCWSGDQIVYRNAYRKPTRAARSLVQCDQELAFSALVECPIGEGLLLLSQLDIRDKPTDPVARRILANLIRYARDYHRESRPVAAVLAESDPRTQLLTAAGVQFTRVTDPISAMKNARIVIVDATPETLRTLATQRDAVRTFTESGGWLITWNVPPAGLADFNRLVGYDHVMRPFRRERVTLAPVRDPLAAGLALRDVALESAEKIYPWAGDRYPASDSFSHVVDLTDIAPFARSSSFQQGWSQMTNGLTSADSWKFIFYHDQSTAGERPSWSATLPKREQIRGLSLIINGHYRKLTQLRVVFDGNRDQAITLNLKPEAERRQDFSFPPRECQSIALEPLAWTPHEKPVIGIDNLWLTVQRPAHFEKQVVPLLNIGALVKYPIGSGGILLNQVNVLPTEANPENADRKRALVATLLRNLGAGFTPERLLMPSANLRYEPLPLGEKCNGYLTQDRGFPGKPDLRSFPVGEQKFAGVRYRIRDFRTSPLPAAIVLNTTTQTVSGIPANTRADALFFLHTFIQTRPWQAPRPRGQQKPPAPPTVFQYRIHYKDGETVTVPVRLNDGVAAHATAHATGLPTASLAWTAENDGQHLAVYQMPWTNPRPHELLTSIEIVAEKGYGIPVILGITAGKEKP
ncbi:MAG: hypothetical protein LC104_10755 [Bacteroidales bacterium]|nr:hypothetical protein [Bacteroidales bacterium]